jgi:hypothetical protein
MRIDTGTDYLDVSESETDPFRQKIERHFSLPYAVMRSGLVGGDGTRLTFVAGRSRIEPTSGSVAAVQAAIEHDYREGDAAQRGVLPGAPRAARQPVLNHPCERTV